MPANRSPGTFICRVDSSSVRRVGWPKATKVKKTDLQEAEVIALNEFVMAGQALLSSSSPSLRCESRGKCVDEQPCPGRELRRWDPDCAYGHGWRLEAGQNEFDTSLIDHPSYLPEGREADAQSRGDRLVACRRIVRLKSSTNTRLGNFPIDREWPYILFRAERSDDAPMPSQI